MAFHLACPITCQKICYCTLGFSEPLQTQEGRQAFLDDITRLEKLLSNPGLLVAGGRETVEVLVPRISKDFKPKKKNQAFLGGLAQDDDDVDERLSTQTKQAAMRKRATLASLAAEDYARKYEQGDFTGTYAEAEALMRSGKHKGTYLTPDEVTARNLLGEEQGSLVPKIMCRICFRGEDEGTKKAERMLSCRTCNKKYHRSCIKHLAENRDLFNWASWVCPSCVTCEVCKRTGDPNKFMFCKRCDAACHSYCQQPPHKNVTPGPYLCPKHTRCHSCGSTVPGSGLSTRWFLGYTSCDACGRLFIKGKYCPVCLKVYRDSESTPMVCCDACQHWVHCVCDGISEEKYQQFQADGNLYYRCAACRGDCYKVKDLDDAVQEIWRRRDEVDQEQIASLRSAAGLLPQQEMIHLCPSSDDEKELPCVESKEELTKISKVAPKGIPENASKNGKEQGAKQKDLGKRASKNTSANKKHVKKKGPHMQPNGRSGTPKTSSQRFQSETKVEEHLTASQNKNSLGYEKIEEAGSHKSDGIKFYTRPKIISSGNAEISVEDAVQNTVLKSTPSGGSLSGKKSIKGHKSKKSSKLSHRQTHDEAKITNGKSGSKAESSKGTKIVIHLPARDKSIQVAGKSCQLPASEASSSHREQGSAGSQVGPGTRSEDTNDQKPLETGKHGFEAYDQNPSAKDEKGIIRHSRGIAPTQSWGIHSGSTRQQLLSSKSRAIDTSVGKLKKSYREQKASSEEGGNLGSLRTGKLITDEYESDEFLPEADGILLSNAPSVTSKVQRNKDGSFEDLPVHVSQDEDSLELPKKRLKVKDIGGQTGTHENEASGVFDDLSSKRSLKVKFKKPSLENTSPWVPRRDEDEGSLIKGQRSKRKRPHTREMERQVKEDRESSFNPNEDTVSKIVDDNWILKKLGKDAVGKRVEVYRPSDGTWHKGFVTGMIEKSSTFTVHLDDGRDETLELGKQSVRFISQSKKRSRT
eukprot:Gb_08461 [translate_table: standard]